MRKILFGLTAFGLLLFIGSCQKDEGYQVPSGSQVDVSALIGDNQIVYDLDPNGMTPLSAELSFSSPEPTKVELTVLGPKPVHKSFDEFTKEHKHPILGLYADQTNTVVLKLMNSAGNFAYDTLLITTGSLYEGMPTVEIDVQNTALMEPGMHLVGCHMANNGLFESRPFVFDGNGAYRYLLDLSSYGRITWPIQRLRNGNFLVVNLYGVYEVDMLGNELMHNAIGGYRAHHDAIEMPNGNLLISVERYDAQINDGTGMVNAADDHVIEISRGSGQIVTEWDLRQLLDVDRHDLANGGGDWFHMNAIWYSEKDDCLILSGRNQGVVKVDRNNNLKWILAPHKGWGKAGYMGEGAETAPFLLTAVDAAGSPYAQDIQDGDIADAGFDWTWGQHAPVLKDNGNILIFDNGFNRQFGAASGAYSRAVEYKIDENNLTVQQVWEYGTDRGTETFSAIISDVDIMPNTKNILFTPGIVVSPEGNHAKIVELTYPAKQEVFEANVMFKNLKGSGQLVWGQMDIAYRSERFDLYP
jgi:arylsulfate sulfotransferase